MQNRNRILRIALAVALGLIVVRLFFIQVIEHDAWNERAVAQQTSRTTLKAERGEIYMMNGDEVTPVVLNESVFTVIVDPAASERLEVAEPLEQILGDDLQASWDDVFANKNSRYYVIARGVSRDKATQIAEAGLTGIWLQENTKRVYPEGTLAASVLGFVNAEGEGQYGVEGGLDAELAGKDGLLKTITDINDVALSIGSDNVRIPAENGQNIVLTIDRNLQAGVERVLADTINRYGKTNGSALVMDPNTGEVLAMANYPTYDPADYGNVSDIAVYNNGILTDAYEPASVAKTFTFAAAINEGVMTPESTYVNTGSVEVDNWNIRNAEQSASLLGTINMQTVLNYSLNTGSIQALMWLGGDAHQITQQGREILYDYYYNRFGLGNYTGIELTEVKGTVGDPNEGTGLNSLYANMTFGQNMQVTMIQVAAAFCSVVNGGHYYAPTVVAGTVDADGNFQAKEAQAPARETISASTSEQMRSMLYGTRKAWRNNGTDPAGYYVGGKTGTAQTIVNGKYDSSSTVATYIGFGGTEGELPSYVIMVRMWKDGTVSGGQEHALPLFNAIKGYVQDYLRVAPAVE